jgi:hypothetical protein
MHRSKLRRAAFASMTVVPLLACLSCGSDEVVAGSRDPEGFPILTMPHASTCGGYGARLRACGILTEGPFACVEPETEAGRCELGCFAGASCTLLWDFQCRSVPLVIERCLETCNAFTCDNGEQVWLDWQCDAEADCTDASDEVDCSFFQCRSGEMIVERQHCNWEPDCLDGSDEVGCAGFACASGGSVAPASRCDNFLDCPDASDEADCPSLVCTSTGEVLPGSWRCDQIHDCLDGSDELGCAELLCR